MDIFNTIDTTLMVESVSELTENGELVAIPSNLRAAVYKLYSGRNCTENSSRH